MQFIRSYLVVVACMAVIGGAVLAEEVKPDAEQDARRTQSKAAIAGYVSNYRAFRYYKCRYQKTSARAVSLKAALEGKWTNAVSAEFRLIVDGDREVSECLAPPPPPPNLAHAKPIPGQPGLYMMPVTFPGGGHMTDGDRELSYSRALQTAGLHGRQAPYRGRLSTPFSMGAMEIGNRHGPDRLDADGDRWAATYLGSEALDSGIVHTVAFRERHHDRGSLSMRFALDPSRGFLPARINVDYLGKPAPAGESKTQAHLMSARECSGQRWFPERTLVIDAPDKVGDLYSVMEIKLLQLDADERPSDDDFVLDVPFGTAVHDPSQPAKGFFKLKQEESINLKDLPALFDMLDRAKSEPLMDTAIPHRSSWHWPRLAGVAVGLVLIFAVIAYVARRRGIAGRSND